MIGPPTALLVLARLAILVVAVKVSDTMPSCTWLDRGREYDQALWPEAATLLNVLTTG